MKAFLIAALSFFLALGIASWGAVEWACGWWGEAFRASLLRGCAAGFVVNLAALPFMARMAGLTREQVRNGAVWTWFLFGFLARLGVLIGAYLLLKREPGGMLRQSCNALIAVYFAGLIFEVLFLGKQISSTDVK